MAYHIIEGARQDRQEGKVTFQWNVKAPNYRINDAGKLVYNGPSDQNIRFHRESINPHYIMCTAHPRRRQKSPNDIIRALSRSRQ